jgi:N-methylhydantoinase A/oxoprolinase/acetone carboxylase beta subunit
MRIGIDVGGTHTDAVLLDGDRVVAAHKALTSADVTTGITQALAALLTNSLDAAEIVAVMIGTTQFTNAVVERKELSEVAAIRLALPSGQGLPPKVGWPEDIARMLGDHVYLLHGGFLYDGKPLAQIRESEIDAVIADLKAKGLRAAAITSAFSPMEAEPELYVARRVRAALPDIRLTLSHRIGRVGLLERENASLLNAGLLEFAGRVVEAFHKALASFGLKCPIYISQNDGTLMDIDVVREFPALTFASGPTNSLRGAARLTGIEDAIVIDIGGTTSDIGVLRGGFPRESNMVIEFGGVRTNFRMPDVLAIGLGGGSLVTDEGRKIGPESVGHRLRTEALVFGGQTLTATDLMVAAGRASVGDRSLVAHLDLKMVETGLETLRAMLEAGVRKMKPSPEPMPVILVGGGAILAPDKLLNASKLLIPEHSGVANAIGAAIAQVGGEAERFVSYSRISRQDAIFQVTEQAIKVAVSSGAKPDTIRVIDIDEVAIPYLEGGATRIRVKVVGELAIIHQGSIVPC